MQKSQIGSFINLIQFQNNSENTTFLQYQCLTWSEICMSAIMKQHFSIDFVDFTLQWSLISLAMIFFSKDKPREFLLAIICFVGPTQVIFQLWNTLFCNPFCVFFSCFFCCSLNNIVEFCLHLRGLSGFSTCLYLGTSGFAIDHW